MPFDANNAPVLPTKNLFWGYTHAFRRKQCSGAPHKKTVLGVIPITFDANNAPVLPTKNGFGVMPMLFDANNAPELPPKTVLVYHHAQSTISPIAASFIPL
jgi:hypothetical protein